MNICDSCINLHPEPDHEVLKFHNLKPTECYIKEIENEIENQKINLNNFYENSKKILDQIYNYLNKYIIIEKTFLNRYRSNVYNYQILLNIKNESLFYDNIIFQDLKEFNDDKKGLENKLNILIKIIENMKRINKKEEKPIIFQQNSNSTNQLTIKYKIKERNPINRDVKIFDSAFVENNKNKCEIEIQYKERNQHKISDNKKLREYFRNYSNSEELTIILREKYMGNDSTENQLITDMSYMFNNCKSFYSVDFSKWSTSNITNIERCSN